MRPAIKKTFKSIIYWFLIISHFFFYCCNNKNDNNSGEPHNQSDTEVVNIFTPNEENVSQNTTPNSGEILLPAGNSNYFDKDIIFKITDSEGNPIEGVKVTYSEGEKFIYLNVKDEGGKYKEKVIFNTPEELIATNQTYQSTRLSQTNVKNRKQQIAPVVVVLVLAAIATAYDAYVIIDGIETIEDFKQSDAVTNSAVSIFNGTETGTVYCKTITEYIQYLEAHANIDLSVVSIVFTIGTAGTSSSIKLGSTSLKLLGKEVGQSAATFGAFYLAGKISNWIIENYGDSEEIVKYLDSDNSKIPIVVIEDCGINSVAFVFDTRPFFKILSPKEGDVVNSFPYINCRTCSILGIDEIKYYLDGNEVYYGIVSPSDKFAGEYLAIFNSQLFNNGRYSLTGSALGEKIGSDQIHIQINNSQSCTSHSYKECSDGDIYWFDNCGNREEIYESCGSDKSCLNGECVVNCVPHSYKDCYNGNLYWYNSCGEREDIYEFCSYSCSNSACLNNNQISILNNYFQYRVDGEWVKSSDTPKLNDRTQNVFEIINNNSSGTYANFITMKHPDGSFPNAEWTSYERYIEANQSLKMSGNDSTFTERGTYTVYFRLYKNPDRIPSKPYPDKNTLEEIDNMFGGEVSSITVSFEIE